MRSSVHAGRHGAAAVLALTAAVAIAVAGATLLFPAPAAAAAVAGAAAAARGAGPPRGERTRPCPPYQVCGNGRPPCGAGLCCKRHACTSSACSVDPNTCALRICLADCLPNAGLCGHDSPPPPSCPPYQVGGEGEAAPVVPAAGAASNRARRRGVRLIR